MSDGNGTQENQKAAKVRRKPECESVLTPTFAAARHSISGTLWDRNQQGSGLLQRQCACGTHTIGGGECDTCRKKRESSFWQRTAVRSVPNSDSVKVQTSPESLFAYDFSRIPTHTKGIEVTTSAAEPQQERGVGFVTIRTPVLHQIPMSHIGQEQSNGHLQRVISAEKGGPRMVPYQSRTPTLPPKDWQMPLPPNTQMASTSSYVQRDISTPLPKGVKVSKSGSATFKVGNVTVILQPDTKSKAKKMKGEARTNFKPGITKIPAYHFSKKGKKVTKILGPPPSLTLRIQTVYGPGTTAKSKSAYGKGTTKEDIKTGKTSLGYHEGSHGSDFIKYLKDNPPPQFKGKVGMSVASYKKAAKTYDKELKKYLKKIEQDSVAKTDCVGTKADFCK